MFRYLWSINSGPRETVHRPQSRRATGGGQANTPAGPDTELQSRLNSLELMRPNSKDDSIQIPRILLTGLKDKEQKNFFFNKLHPWALTEVRVLHGLFGSQSLLMVVSQKFVQKI